MELNSDDLVRRTRRLFIKKGLRAGGMLALSPLLLSIINCAHDPYKQKPEEFTIENFDRWYKSNRLYNKMNPNLDGPHSTMHTFKEAFPNGWTPGISYDVPYGEIMVASAPGYVVDIHELHTGRAGGNVVTVGHPVESFYELGRFTHLFHTYYAHLNKVYVKLGDQVKRGDPIGNVTEHNRYAKLMLTEKRRQWIDPDSHGTNHSYMKYNSDVIIDDKDMISNLEIVQEKWATQGGIYNSFVRHFYDREKLSLDTKMHKKTGYGACRWSTVEKFKYIEALYEVKPDLFPELSEEKFQSMKKEFYDNQPIVLTLPF